MTLEQEAAAGTLEVKSRIAWGALFAGAFIAFTVMVILDALGLAMGLTSNDTSALGAGLWAIFVALVALFAGGWVMSYIETHETRLEAALHGVVLWGILVFGLLMLAVSGVQLGLNMIVGIASTILQQADIAQILAAGREMGLDEAQVAQLRHQLTAANFPALQSAWWAVAAMVVSLIAVIAGAVGGSQKSHHVTRRPRARAPLSDAEPAPT